MYAPSLGYWPIPLSSCGMTLNSQPNASIASPVLRAHVCSKAIREEDDQHILITDDTVVEAFYQVESLLTRLLKEINRSKATSPTPTQKLAVAKNLTIMGISDREIMETRPGTALKKQNSIAERANPNKNVDAISF